MGPTEYVLTPSPLGYKQSQPPTCCKKATLFLGSINHRAMKIHVGSEVIAPHIVNHDTRQKWVFIFRLQPPYPWRKGPWYPLDRELGGPKSQSEQSCPCQELNCDHSPNRLVITLTELSQLILNVVCLLNPDNIQRKQTFVSKPLIKSLAFPATTCIIN
jgi:hypothetical protein